MGFITIDGRKVEFTDEKNILTIIRKAAHAWAYRVHNCETVQAVKRNPEASGV